MPVVEVVDVVDVFEGEQDKQWMTKHRANTRVLEQEYIQLALLHLFIMYLNTLKRLGR